jgi:hypothetical protein
MRDHDNHFEQECSRATPTNRKWRDHTSVANLFLSRVGQGVHDAVVEHERVLGASKIFVNVGFGVGFHPFVGESAIMVNEVLGDVVVVGDLNNFRPI